jgi:hypothetical protein
MHLPPSQNNYIKVYQYAHKLKRRGKTPAQIKHELAMQGIDDKTAENISTNIEHYSRGLQKKVGETNMLQGTAWLTGGIIIMVVAYNAAPKSTACYAIAGGAALVGAVMFIKGVRQRL